MSSTIEIYGTTVTLPQPKEGIHVEDWGYPNDTKEQYWRKIPLPILFNEVDFDKEGNALLNYQQAMYAREEVRRCKEGFFFLNNGEVTYVSGKHYFYLQWWRLEDDINPDYRDLDRRYFLFLEHWENVPWCLGIVVGKKRRQGATSIATSNLVYECIFFKNSFCGLTSKTLVDAKAAFTNMVSFGYRQLPIFLKPKQLNNKDSVSELVFAHKSVSMKGEKGSAIDTDTGHRSKVDYRAPSLNSYDSGRLSRGLFDEGGKWPRDTPFSNFLSIVSKTLVKGAKRVGFIECPSTSNAMSNGGEEFKRVWDSANQFKYDKTPNRLVKYVTPAYDGFLGFIDRYGKSVVDEPTEDQFNYLVENFVGAGDLSEEDIRLGAKHYLLKRRQDLEGVALEEEIRMNPFDEREMFMLRNTNCLFDAVVLNNCYDVAKAAENQLVSFGNLIWKDGVAQSDVEWVETSRENARFKIAKEYLKWWLDNRILENVVEKRNNLFFPKNYISITIGLDPYQHSVVESGGSKAAAYAYLRYDTSGLTQFDKSFICQYYARPQMVSLMADDIMKMCFFFGCQVLVENNRDGNSRAMFKDAGMEAFLMKLPQYSDYGIPATENNKRLMVNLMEDHVTTSCADGKMHFHELADDLIRFDLHDTEEFDLSMAACYTLCGDFYKRHNIRKTEVKRPSVSDYFKKHKVV